MLKSRWQLRPRLKQLPQFGDLPAMVIDKLSRIATWMVIDAGQTLHLDDEHAYLFVEGEASATGHTEGPSSIMPGEALGWRPHAQPRIVDVTAASRCGLISIKASEYQQMLQSTPTLNYHTRKQQISEGDTEADWLLGVVDVY